MRDDYSEGSGCAVEAAAAAVVAVVVAHSADAAEPAAETVGWHQVVQNLDVFLTAPDHLISAAQHGPEKPADSEV